MKLRTITKQNEVPYFEIVNTELTPSEITLEFEGFEKGVTQYISINTTEGEELGEYELDSIMYSMLTALQEHEEYIISIDSTTARTELDTVESITELLEWVEN